MSRTLAQGLSGAFALTLAPAFATMLACQPRATTTDCFTGDAQVVIEVSSAGIKVTPMVAIVKPGATLLFLVKGLEEGQTVELDFNVADVAGGKKGPFAALKGQVRGRVVLTRGVPDAKVVYETAETYQDQAWKYEIVVRDADGVDRVAKDPMIVGRGL